MGTTLLLLAMTAAAGQSPAPPAKQPDALAALAAARARYESQVARMREEAHSRILEGTQRVNEKLAEETAFVDGGVLPSGAPFDKLRREFDALVLELLRAYEVSADQILRAEGGRAVAMELVAEQELWSRVMEWAAWRNVSVSLEAPNDSEAATVHGIDFDLVDSARIEVNGSLSGPGPIRLQIPVGDDAAIEVELVTKGDAFHCIMTRGDSSTPSLDVGFDRRRPAVPIEVALGNCLRLLDPRRCVTNISVRWKPITLGEARALPTRGAPADAAGTRPHASAAGTVPGWPAGTEFIGIRTRSNGNPKGQHGSVLSNDGKQMVVHVHDFHQFRYYFEHTGNNKFRLAKTEGAEPKANSVVPRTSALRVEDGSLTGAYKWVVNEKSDVDGTFELWALGTFGKAQATRTARRDPLEGHDAWSSGSTVAGVRADTELAGQVLSCDGKRLRVLVREAFQVKGKKHSHSFVYELERNSDGKQGEIRYRLVDQVLLEDGPDPPDRSDFDGALTLSGDTLSGQIRFKESPRAIRRADNEFSLRVTKSARP